MKNEKGYTLVLVMIIITVTVTLGLALSAIVLNTRTQLNKTEGRNKATDLAEMGITYYQSELKKLIGTAEENTKRTSFLTVNASVNLPSTDLFANVKTFQFNRDFCRDLQTQNANRNWPLVPVGIDGKNQYQIVSSTIDCSNVNNGEVTANFVSKGTTAGSNPVSLSGSLTITKNASPSRTGQSAPVPSQFTDYNFLNLVLNGNDRFNTAISTYFPGMIDMRGNTVLSVDNNVYIDNLSLKGDADLIIKGDGVFNQVNWLNGNVRLVVFGDAIFKNPIVNLRGSSIDICIFGNIYTTDQDNKLVNYTLPIQNKCSDPNGNGHWGIDVHQTSVNYNY